MFIVFYDNLTKFHLENPLYCFYLLKTLRIHSHSLNLEEKLKLIYIPAISSNVRANALENIPLKRFGKPEEVAEAALFLVRNEYANNCTINLDGGLSAAVSIASIELVVEVAPNTSSSCRVNPEFSW